MRWLDVVNRDPVPWLLDPSNPSARYLTLRWVFEAPPDALEEEQQRILAWAPVQGILQHWDRTNFWGRIANPYYGGAMGNFGTLYLLYQLGAPRFPEIEPVCENLLKRGRTEDGRFMPPGGGPALWLCYTGMALRMLDHFGYSHDPRVRSSWTALIEEVLSGPEHLACPLADGPCQDGLIRVLDALLHRPLSERGDEDGTALDMVRRQLTQHAALLDRRGRNEQDLHFPRYDHTDLIEVVHTLAQTRDRAHPRVGELLETMLSIQDENGRWRKLTTTPALIVEGLQEPSRWLTLEAVHAVMLIYGGNTYAA